AVPNQVRASGEPQDREGDGAHHPRVLPAARRRGDRIMREPMHRRSFLTLLGGAAAAWPVVARGHQRPVPPGGILGGASPEPYAAQLSAFRQGLRELGFVEGQNVAIDYRWANNQYDQLPALAAELVRSRVALIAAIGNNLPARAAKSASPTIP